MGNGIITRRLETVLPFNIVTDGLICYLDSKDSNSYNSTSTWFDLSGNNNNATLVNNPSYVNGLLDFNGSNQRVDFNQRLMGGLDGLTMFIGVSFDVIDDGNQLGAQEEAFWWRQYNDRLGYDLGQTSTNTWFDASGGSNTGSQNYIGKLSPNVFYNLNWGFDRYGNGGSSGRVYLYEDGVFDKSINTNRTGPIINGSTDLSLAVRNSSNSSYLNGKMGYFLLYNRKLTDQEITQTYNALNERFNT